MSKTKVFCFGFGQVAESFVNKLIDEKKNFDLSVTSRQETHQIEFNNIKINSYQFTKDNFDNLKDLIINKDKVKIGNNQIMISGTLIVDSLKAKFPNEYAKLSFNPIVDVVVDTSKWLINSVTSRIDTLKLFQIKNYYEFYENKYYLPSTSTVEYFIKDMKLANWLKDDIPSVIGADQQLAKGQDIVKGTITVKYSDYLINKKLPDYIFKKKRID